MIPKMFHNVDLLQKGMDASWLRNEVITNNIANAETPNFKSSSVAFETMFKKALEDQAQAPEKDGGSVQKDAFSNDIPSQYENKRTRDKHIVFSQNEDIVDVGNGLNQDFSNTRTRGSHFDFDGSREPGSLDDVSPVVSQNDDLTMRMDGNNVDIEAENVALARNTIYYYTLTEQMNSEFARLGMAIREGK
ncbi:MAG TPA: flagellar basal body protein [Feifaniaceae bacterium]|nr:flagellar basal body protein [Feifaniaceae bacterium]